ncbi:hypothetical protein QZH41_013556 [Actinostola sp. cb2023]|nr:hypothetical protein QZH41_013556 [Actinostola sp. cb2023]
MNLLPKSKAQFKTKEYWDNFFRKRREAFEWYGDYFELSSVLHKYSKVKDDILVLGCGNSRLSEDLYDLGYHGLVNIDISDVVISQMKDRNKEKRANMEFIKMDMLKMSFKENQFNVILDKGTLDAIFVSEDAEVVSDVNQMFSEIQRVLQTNGRYICITLVQEHILDQLLSHFSNGWFIRVHYVETNSPLPVFAFIFTKTNFSGKIPNMATNLNNHCSRLTSLSQIQRVTTVSDIKSAIQSKQEYALVKQSLRKFNPGNSFSLELWSSETTDGVGHREPRYTLTVVDLPPSLSHSGLYAIFIVPQGRETDWCFSSEEGRKDLASTAKYQRLVVVTLHRGHQYESIETIKQELSAKAMDLAPEGVTNENLVPFLSAGGDIGIRETLEKGHSEVNGDYVIEDVFGEGSEKIRHLVFLDNPDVIQSEAKIKTDPISTKGRKGKTKRKTESRVDHSYLIGRHLQGIAAGLAFVDGLFDQGSKKAGLLVGLGGGSLAMFIHEFYPQIILDAIEIDPVVVHIAKKWFECKEDDRLQIITEDGLQFIKTQALTKESIYHIIILDINETDELHGVLGPPIGFLDPGFLCKVKKLLHKQGVLTIDFGCKNKGLHTKLLKDIQSVFSGVYILKIQGLVNEIVFAVQQESKVTHIKKSVEDLQKFGETSKQWNEDTDLCDVMKNLKIL